VLVSNVCGWWSREADRDDGGVRAVQLCFPTAFAAMHHFTRAYPCARRAVVCWVDRVRQECDAGWPRKCMVFLASDSGVVRARQPPACLLQRLILSQLTHALLPRSNGCDHAAHLIRDAVLMQRCG